MLYHTQAPYNSVIVVDIYFDTFAQRYSEKNGSVYAKMLPHRRPLLCVMYEYTLTTHSHTQTDNNIGTCAHTERYIKKKT